MAPAACTSAGTAITSRRTLPGGWGPFAQPRHHDRRTFRRHEPLSLAVAAIIPHHTTYPLRRYKGSVGDFDFPPYDAERVSAATPEGETPLSRAEYEAKARSVTSAMMPRELCIDLNRGWYYQVRGKMKIPTETDAARSRAGCQPKIKIRMETGEAPNAGSSRYGLHDLH